MAPRTYSDDAYDYRKVSIKVFAANMSEYNMAKVLERECGPVLSTSFSRSPHPKTRVCIVTFENEAGAEAAMQLGRSRRPVYHPDLGISWRKGLDISRHFCRISEHTTTHDAYTSSPESLPGTTPKCAEVSLHSFVTEAAAGQPSEAPVAQQPYTEVPATTQSLLPSESSFSESIPSKTTSLAAEIQVYKVKHKEVVIANDLLRLRVEEVHRRIKSTRDSLGCQNDMAAATMERINQAKGKIDDLKTDLKKAEEEQASLSILQDEAEADIVEIAQVEEQLAGAMVRNEALEALLAKVTQRIDAEEKTRADRALRAKFNEKLNGIGPSFKRTFMSDTMMHAFWRVHELVDKCIEEVCSGQSRLDWKDGGGGRKKQKLDETGRVKICFRLPNVGQTRKSTVISPSSRVLS